MKAGDVLLLIFATLVLLLSVYMLYSIVIPIRYHAIETPTAIEQPLGAGEKNRIPFRVLDTVFNDRVTYRAKVLEKTALMDAYLNLDIPMPPNEIREYSAHALNEMKECGWSKMTFTPVDLSKIEDVKRVYTEINNRMKTSCLPLTSVTE